MIGGPLYTAYLWVMAIVSESPYLHGLGMFYRLRIRGQWKRENMKQHWHYMSWRNLLPPTPTLRRLAPYLLVLAVAFAAYSPILWNGSGFSHPDDLAVVQGQSFELSGYAYRPVATLTYMLNRRFGGWMATNLALHLIAAVLVLALSRSWVAGCLFAAHPMATDAVASIAGRSMELFAVFVLAALLALRSKRISSFAALCVLALLCLWTPPSRAASAALPLVEAGLPPTPGHIEHFHLFASALGTYIVPRMLVPVRLSPDPGPHYSYLGEAVGLLALPLGLPLIPYALMPLQDVFLEHRAYLALAWIAMLAGLTSIRRRPVLAAAIVGVFIVGTWQRVAVYQYPISLWEDARDKAPDKMRPHFNLGTYYAQQGRFVESERELLQAVAHAPHFRPAAQNLSLLYLLRGDVAHASEVLDAANIHETRVIR